MTVELNAAFVPERLREELEMRLETAWAGTEAAPGQLQLKWVHRDPGEFVVAVEYRDVRIEPGVGHAAVPEPEGDVHRLIGTLSRELSESLRHRGR
jgi:hypothetical protein